MNIEWKPIISENLKEMKGTAWRAVENQGRRTTEPLVDTLEELEVLEHCIDGVKPKVPMNIDSKFSNGYLLTTPFRYPPHDYGSRFSTRHEVSLFYGSKEKQTALTEGAFYGFVFYDGMKNPPLTPIKQKVSVFSVKYSASNGVELHSSPFSDHQEVLKHPTKYSETQKLGAIMRDIGVDGFEFSSARCDGGINIGFYNTAVFRTNPDIEDWIKLITAHDIEYLPERRSNHEQSDLKAFNRDGFMVDGVFPTPAA